MQFGCDGEGEGMWPGFFCRGGLEGGGELVVDDGICPGLVV